MEFDLTTILSIGVVLFFGGMLQGVVGFAYGLFATPVLLVIGVPLPSAIAIVGTCSVITCTLGARKLKEDLPWKVLTVATGTRFVFTIVGVLLLKRIVTLDKSVVQLIVGTALMGMVLAQIILRPKPRDHISPVMTGVAFMTSGFLSGFVGMGGPPVVIWVMALTWEASKTRAFTFTLFAISGVTHLLLMYMAFGQVVARGILTGMLYVPVVYTGTTIGLKIGNKVAKPLLRKLAYGLLVLVALNAIIPALIKYLGT